MCWNSIFEIHYLFVKLFLLTCLSIAYIKTSTAAKCRRECFELLFARNLSTFPFFIDLCTPKKNTYRHRQNENTDRAQAESDNNLQLNLQRSYVGGYATKIIKTYILSCIKFDILHSLFSMCMLSYDCFNLDLKVLWFVGSVKIYMSFSLL